MSHENEMAILTAKHHPEAQFIVGLTDPERDRLRAVLNHTGMGLNDFVVETKTPVEAIVQMRIGLLAISVDEQKVVAIALELMM